MKGLGRKVSNFDKELWDKEAKNCVRDGVLLKFEQNKELRDYLLSTGEAYLVEASPSDSIWGIGLDAQAARQTKVEDWPGTNWLGEVLMDVRHYLRTIANEEGKEEKNDD